MQPILDLLQESPTLLISLTFIFSLMVGSFLNVVIYRLPIMMNRNWRKECLEYLELAPDPEQETFNLFLPHSSCPHCNTQILPQQNIPVLSYLFLKGACAHCGTPISPRYPLIEALTAICSAMVAWQFGYGVDMCFALLLTWCLIALSFIDIDHQLLPDSMTLPLLWLGIFLSLFDVFTDTDASIIGAIAGYLSLWSVYMGFKLLTGKEGMGFGDFKLLAMFGAWLGWHYIVLIILLSSLVGATIGISMVLLTQHDRNIPIPYGPYLAAAGWLALLWGEQINNYYLDFLAL